MERDIVRLQPNGQPPKIKIIMEKEEYSAVQTDKSQPIPHRKNKLVINFTPRIKPLLYQVILFLVKLCLRLPKDDLLKEIMQDYTGKIAYGKDLDIF